MNRNLIIISSITVFVLLAVGLGVFFVSRSNQGLDTRSDASGATGINTSLSFDQISDQITVDQEFTVTLNINSSAQDAANPNSIVSLDLFLDYDKDALEYVDSAIVGESSGGYFPDAVAGSVVKPGVNPDIGTIYYRIAQTGGVAPVAKTGSHKLATITFKAKDSGNAQVRVGNNSRAGDPSPSLEFQNVLIVNNLLPLTFSIADAGGSATVTPTVTVAPTSTSGSGSATTAPTPTSTSSSSSSNSSGSSSNSGSSSSSSSSSSTSSQSNTLPEAGLVENTIIIAVLSLLLLGAGIAILAA